MPLARWGCTVQARAGVQVALRLWLMGLYFTSSCDASAAGYNRGVPVMMLVALCRAVDWFSDCGELIRLIAEVVEHVELTHTLWRGPRKTYVSFSCRNALCLTRLMGKREPLCLSVRCSLQL